MLNFIFLQAANAAAPQQGSQWSFWIMMILIFVVFYFFMIRPQTKKQKELQKQREAMKKGDKVITAGGIHGIIREVQDTTFLIEVAKDVVLKLDKASVYASAEDVQADAANANTK
ncbi:MAG: preprotein translocase subunit YajC [Paludibacteraceae bacterium]|nr:preprotein translocase subunit YajC [Paludibacteraceae bacterium]